MMSLVHDEATTFQLDQPDRGDWLRSSPSAVAAQKVPAQIRGRMGGQDRANLGECGQCRCERLPWSV